MTDTDKLTSILQLLITDKSCRVDVAHGAILDLFLTLVPEDRHSKFHDELSERAELRCDGWNRCRSQLLAKIESLRK